MVWVNAIFVFLVMSTELANTPLQAAQMSLFTSSEQRSLSTASKLPYRAKTYVKAAGRYLKAAEESAKAGENHPMLKSLASYSLILEKCRDELVQLPEKKTKEYKKPEITLRKYISQLEDLEVKLSYDTQPHIQKSISISKELRLVFLNTFFGSKSLKKP